MRPLRLAFNGINSFSEPAEIDFTSLLEYGLFGIFGDTGSGKSTILDCITFALYGTVARTPRGGVVEIINRRLDKAYVNFEFEIDYRGKRRHFRVERTIKRKNAIQTLKIIDCENDVVLSDGVREGGSLLTEIIGLSEEDFEKCIVLPQGEFAQFIKEQRGDRLKFVTRLFDLEEYGEKLSKRAGSNFTRLDGELKVLRTRLELYGEVTEEQVKALEEEVSKNTEEEAVRRKEAERARAREALVSEYCRKAEEAERVNARLAELGREAEEISALEKELGRAEQAEPVAAAEKERLFAERELTRARESLARAQCEAEEGEKLLAAFPAGEQEKLDEEISRLTELRAEAVKQEETARRARELGTQLDDMRAAYADENKQFRGFSYEEEREKLEKELSELGEEDFSVFVGQHAGELFRDEYAVFAGELIRIRTKYPETAEDVSPLVDKYTLLSQGEQGDFLRLREEFEAREKKRKEVRDTLLALEKRNGLYSAHREKLMQLQTGGERLKKELDALSLPSNPLSREEIERELAAKKTRKRERGEALEEAKKRLSAAQAEFAAARERERSARETDARAKEHLNEALLRGGFASAREAEELLSRLGDGNGRERVKKFREEQTALLARKEELSEEDLSSYNAEVLARAREELSRATQAVEETVCLVAVGRDKLERGKDSLERKKELLKEEQRLAKETAIAERLKKLLEGNKFMEYVAEEYLQDITERASTRLLSLTSGQYFLRYDKGFLVGDNLNGGTLRAVYTLSGGETFLVSLSLALSLSTEICIKAARPIEFFFLDEGFGTLDSDLVDTVMDSLEKLKGSHFSIGIISHVEELKHRIVKKITVEKATDSHGSRINF